MNQILVGKNETDYKPNTIVKKSVISKIYKFKILFILCIVFFILLMCYYLYFWNDLYNKEELSSTLKSTFNIRQLYSR